jgi:hypothetical protein
VPGRLVKERPVRDEDRFHQAMIGAARRCKEEFGDNPTTGSSVKQGKLDSATRRLLRELHQLGEQLSVLSEVAALKSHSLGTPSGVIERIDTSVLQSLAEFFGTWDLEVNTQKLAEGRQMRKLFGIPSFANPM